MRNRLKLISVLFIIIGIIYFSKTVIIQNHINYPNDYNFILKYGVGGKNEINTFTDTFTKDTVDGSITINLKLSDEDKYKIFNEMKKISIMDINNRFKIRTPYIEPCDSSYLKVEFDNVERVFTWSTKNFDIKFDIEMKEKEINDKEYIQLKQISDLSRFIQEIINNHEEVKKLPKSPMYL